MQKEIEDLHIQVIGFVNKLIADGVEPFAIAAVLSTTSSMIYRTSLSEEEYQDMMRVIYDARNKFSDVDVMLNGSIH